MTVLNTPSFPKSVKEHILSTINNGSKLSVIKLMRDEGITDWFEEQVSEGKLKS